MATTTIPQAGFYQPRQFNFIKLLLFAAIAGSVVLGVHATTKHGNDARQVRECLNQGWELQLWYNPDLDRYIRVCMIQDGRFGLQVVEAVKGNWREITSFVKNKLRTIQQVEKYLANGGANKLWP